MDMMQSARAAKQAAIPLAALPSATKSNALQAIAAALDAGRDEIVAANQADLDAAEREELSAPLLKRLKFDGGKIDEVIAGIHSLIALPEPVGATQTATELAAGLELYRVSCPIGVIGVIFESRPDALVQISTLCLKSGNAVLLKGGSEAMQTNRILARLIAAATAAAGVPAGWLQLLETRADVAEMLKADEMIDLIIPRGSNEFVKYIMEHSNIAVLGHADGICHVYVDAAADIPMAIDIAVDSKCQYVAVCNAEETLLVHADIAAALLPPLREALVARGVEIRGCARTCAIIEAVPATEEDWRTEYLDYTLSIRVVDSMEDALDHINTYGSGHTEVIVTADAAQAARFMDLADAGNTFWNCSTRFSDGFRYGLGAEVGVSTNKIHARGPVGLDGLLIYKWKLIGHGQTVTPFAEGQQAFTHKPLTKSFSI